MQQAFDMCQWMSAVEPQAALSHDKAGSFVALDAVRRKAFLSVRIACVCAAVSPWRQCELFANAN